MSKGETTLVPAGQLIAATPEVLLRIEHRWNGLHERVDDKLQTISALDRRPEARLIEQAASAGTAAKRVLWLRKAADYLHTRVAPLAACRTGCAHCCHIAVVISRAEAQVIAKETGALLNRMAGQFTVADADPEGDRLQAVMHEVTGRACSFLKDGECSIYSSRPLPCRLLLNLDDDPLLCQLTDHGATNVPYLNATQHYIASAAILGAHQDYDDIRAWFPNYQQP